MAEYEPDLLEEGPLEIDEYFDDGMYYLTGDDEDVSLTEDDEDVSL